jgi:hypothetical protein
VTEKGRTPLIFITIEGSQDCKDTIMMYGHMVKQTQKSLHVYMIYIRIDDVIFVDLFICRINNLQ